MTSIRKAGLPAWMIRAGRPDQVALRLDTLSDVEFALRTVTELVGEVEQIELQADEWRSAISAWEDEVAGPLRDLLGGYVHRLERWGMDRRHENPERFTSAVLPSGEVWTRRSSAGRLVVTDEEALLAWARVNAPDAVRVVESVLRSKLGAVDGPDGAVVCAETGEVIPGLERVGVGDVSAGVRLGVERRSLNAPEVRADEERDV